MHSANECQCHQIICYIVNVQDLRLPYVVSIDFWQYKVKVEVEDLAAFSEHPIQA